MLQYLLVICYFYNAGLSGGLLSIHKFWRTIRKSYNEIKTKIRVGLQLDDLGSGCVGCVPKYDKYLLIHQSVLVSVRRRFIVVKYNDV